MAITDPNKLATTPLNTSVSPLTSTPSNAGTPTLSASTSTTGGGGTLGYDPFFNPPTSYPTPAKAITPTVITSNAAKKDLVSKTAYVNNYDQAKAAQMQAPATPQGFVKVNQNTDLYNVKTGMKSTNLAGSSYDPSQWTTTPPGGTAIGTQQGTNLPTTTGTTEAINTGVASGTPAYDTIGQITNWQTDAENAKNDFNQQINDLNTGKTPYTAAEQAQIDNLKYQYDRLIEQQKTYNKNYEGSITQMGIVTGRSRYAPSIETGNIKEAVDQGVQKVADLNAKEEAAMEQLKQAIYDKNYKAISDTYKASQDYLNQRRQTINDISQAVKDQAQAILDQKKQDLAEHQAQMAEDKDTVSSLSYIIGNNLASGMSVADAKAMSQKYASAYGIDSNFLISSALAKQAEIEKGQQLQGTEGEYLNAISRGIIDSSMTYPQFLSMKATAGETPTERAYKEMQTASGYAELGAPKKVGEATYQYNPKTGQYETATAGIGQVDKSAIDDLNYKINLADEILAPGSNYQAIVGIPGPSAFIPGSKANVTRSAVDQIKQMINVENRGKLKGQGQISDFEGRMLAQASTRLNDLRNLSNDAFVKEIQRIKDASASSINYQRFKAGQPLTLQDLVGNNSEMRAKAETIVKNNPKLSEDDVATQLIPKEWLEGQQSFKTGGNGTPIVAKIGNIADGTKAGQCGAFVNDLTGLKLGDSYQSKMSKMDPTIKSPAPGMVFTMPIQGSKYGHTGIILGIQGDKAIVKDSNWYETSKPEQVATHTIPIADMTGFAYPKNFV